MIRKQNVDPSKKKKNANEQVETENNADRFFRYQWMGATGLEHEYHK